MTDASRIESAGDGQEFRMGVRTLMAGAAMLRAIHCRIGKGDWNDDQ